MAHSLLQLTDCRYILIFIVSALAVSFVFSEVPVDFWSSNFDVMTFIQVVFNIRCFKCGRCVNEVSDGGTDINR